MAGPNPVSPEPGPDASTAELQADIEHTRSELGDTAQALTHKLDVKARVTEAASDVKDRAVVKAQDAKTAVVAHTTAPDGSVRRSIPLAAVAVVTVILGIVVWRRRR
jgi:Protein of unknown function (DUF3618)